MKLLFTGPYARLKNSFLLLGILLLLYTMIGFLLLPVIVKHLLISNIREKLQHEAVVEDVAINPFVFTVDVRGFVLNSDSGDMVASFKRFFIDLQAESIINWALTWREITIEEPRLNVVINEAGQMNIMQLLPESPEKEKDKEAGEEESKEAALPSIIIRNLNILQGRTQLTDLSRPSPLRLGFIPVDLHIRELRFGTVDGEAMAPLDISVSLEGGGHIQISGKIQTQPVVANLDINIDRLHLPQIQPILDEFTHAELRSGSFGVQGHLVYDSSKIDALNFSGSAGLNSIVVHDEVEGEDLLRLPAVMVEEIQTKMEPVTLSVKRVTLSKPYLRFSIAQDGSTNIERVMKSADSGKAISGEEVAADAAESVQPDGDKGLQAGATHIPDIKIAEIVVKEGSAWFEDLSIVPAFATSMQKLNGGIKGLATDPDSKSGIKLDGETGPHAPVSIVGNIQLFGTKPSLDMDMIFRNLDLTTLTPYSGKFAGYKIKQGSMDMDLAYDLQGDKLHGSNKILLDQLTLGERVESPDALNLPIALGIALLKDVEGRIDIDLEVEGNVTDPEFSVAGLIWKAIANLLTKIITSPFRFLGSLLGGDPPPDMITFEAGITSLGARQATDLERLATALASRPGLMLFLEGSASEALDTPVLAKQHLEDQLIDVHRELSIESDVVESDAAEPEMAESDVVEEDETLEFLTIEERTAALKELHLRLLGPGENEAGEQQGQEEETMSVPEAPVTEVEGDVEEPQTVPEEEGADVSEEQEIVRMEQELLTVIQVPQEELLKLAQERAHTVANYLVEVGEIDSNRLGYREALIKPDSDAGAPVVKMSLNVLPPNSDVREKEEKGNDAAPLTEQDQSVPSVQ